MEPAQPSTGDYVTVFCMVAGSAYDELAWRSLGLRRGDYLQDLVYEDEFVAPAIAESSVALVCLLYRLKTRRRTKKGSWGNAWAVLPLRWVTSHAGPDSATTGPRDSRSFRVSVGDTVGYHSPECVARRARILVSALTRTASADDAHVKALTDRGLDADHPYLVTSVRRDELMTAFHCGECEEDVTARGADGDGRAKDLDDRRIWDRSLRSVVPSLQQHSDDALGSVGHGLVRLVGIDRVDEDGEPHAVFGVGSDAMASLTTDLKRGTQYRLLVRSRLTKGVIGDAVAMRLSTRVPEHLMSVGVGNEHVGAGTRDHQVEVYAKDRAGRGTIEISVTDPSGDQLTHLHIPVRVVPRYSRRSISAFFLISVGVLATVLAPFATHRHFPWVCWPADQGLTVIGVLAAALGTAIVASRPSS